MKLPIINNLLAKRIQQSETDFFTSRIQSIAERPGNPEGVEIVSFGQAAAFYIRTMPWAVFNSVKGLNHEDAEQSAEIVQFYKDRQRNFQLDIDPIGCSVDLLNSLAKQGLNQKGFHSVLYGLPLVQVPNAPPDIDVIEVITEADFDRYAGVHCAASGMSLEHKHHFVNNNIGLLNRPGWRLFMALWRDEPAAVGAMHISGNIASCALAATVPEYRRKGLQTALIQRRMYEAHLAKCDLVAAQASFGSTSQNNMERVGLQLAWTRAVWGPAN